MPINLNGIDPMSRTLSRVSLALMGLLTMLLLTGCDGPNLFHRLGSPFGFGICGLIVLVLDIIAIMEVLQSSRDSTNKLLWILLIIFFPVGGLIAYYFFGK